MERPTDVVIGGTVRAELPMDYEKVDSPFAKVDVKLHELVRT